MLKLSITWKNELKTLFLLFSKGKGSILAPAKNSISNEIRATKTPAYQAVKLELLSWEMDNSFAEKMLSMYKIYQPYHVFSFLCLFIYCFNINSKTD